MTEQKLLDELCEDPEKGLEAVIARYAGLVHTIVRGKLTSACSEEDIEECAADVFAALYRQAGAIDLNKGTLKAYLATLARRTAIGRYRKAAARGSPVSVDDESLFPSGGAEDPADLAGRSQGSGRTGRRHSHQKVFLRRNRRANRPGGKPFSRRGTKTDRQKPYAAEKEFGK